MVPTPICELNRIPSETSGFDAIRPDWLRLCEERGAGDEPFYRPEWITTYVDAFAPEQSFHVITVREDKGVTGILPVVSESHTMYQVPIRKLRGAANVHSCRFDLLASSSCDTRVLWRQISEDYAWELFELRNVPEGSTVDALMTNAADEGFLVGRCECTRSPYIRVSEAFTAAGELKAGSSHFRQNLRRLRRKAERSWPVGLIRTCTADPSALRAFYELEAKGWKGRSRTAIIENEATHRFYDGIARVAERNGYLSLYTLHFGDRAVAAHFGLTYRSCYYALKVAFDESVRSFGPGQLIVEAILRDLKLRGVATFDFLGNPMEWKLEWTNSCRQHSIWYCFRPTMRGILLYRAKFHVIPTLREISRRLRFPREEQARRCTAH